MTEKVLSFIERNKLLKDGDSVIVALSGGADSVALLHFLKSNEARLNIKVSAAHVNHGIRGEEADSDEAFVIELCKMLDVPLKVFHENIPELAKALKLGEEECGRLRRYELLNQIDDYSLIATAHNLNDNLETVLFNLARGTALKGMCGIPVKRDRIIRPLLNCSRDDIEKYCKTNGLKFVTDSSNSDVRYSRNRIRKHVIPELAAINPALLVSFPGFIETVSRDEDFLEQETDKLLEEAAEDGKYRIDIINSAQPAIKFRALRRIVAEYISGGVEKRHIDTIDSLLLNGGSLDLSSDFRVTSDKTYLFVEEKPKPLHQKAPQPILIVKSTITGEGIELRFENFSISLRIINREQADLLQKINREVCYNLLDYDKMASVIIVRGRNPGDKLRIKERGLTKTLKKLYSEQGLPQNLRAVNPVMADEAGVIWVNGFGADERCAADKNSKNCILISIRR
ncbi:MAG: tRNA lysidine(34) synthetase TilS [Acutalibacteraceae bacterium]|jgi:tRNA(Ile)-lysidine synthase